MLRVLYVIDTLEVGGSERSILDIASTCQGITPFVCRLYPGNTLEPEFTKRNIPVHAFDIPAKYGWPTAVRRLRRLIRRLKPDVVHTTLFRSDVAGRIAARLEGVPVVSSFVNENYGDNHRQHLSRVGLLKNRGVQAIDFATSRLVDRFAANSATMRTAHVDALRLPAERIDVIYRGRRPDKFDVAPEDAQRIVDELNLANKRVITMVARLLRRKAQADLIEAVRGLVVDHPEVVLLIVGDGPDRPHVEAAARGADWVRLLGARRDVPAVLAASHVFVSTSEYEGHPGAVVEAMLAGKAVVLSDIDVHTETIDDGRTGRIFRLHDITALRAVLRALIEDPARASALGVAAREEARRRFDIERIAEEHVALYHRVARR
ncbi:MAG: glycosyltransferase family 4 protein [Deltaproteobacteria bacterium]